MAEKIMLTYTSNPHILRFWVSTIHSPEVGRELAVHLGTLSTTTQGESQRSLLSRQISCLIPTDLPLASDTHSHCSGYVLTIAFIQDLYCSSEKLGPTACMLQMMNTPVMHKLLLETPVKMSSIRTCENTKPLVACWLYWHLQDIIISYNGCNLSDENQWNVARTWRYMLKKLVA